MEVWYELIGCFRKNSVAILLAFQSERDFAFACLRTANFIPVYYSQSFDHYYCYRITVGRGQVYINNGQGIAVYYPGKVLLAPIFPKRVLEYLRATFLHHNISGMTTYQPYRKYHV